MQCFQGFFIWRGVKIHRKHAEIDEKQKFNRETKRIKKQNNRLHRNYTYDKINTRTIVLQGVLASF